MTDSSHANASEGTPAGGDVLVRPDDPESAMDLEARLQFMFALWRQKRNGKCLPARSDLDPTEFHRLWPVTFLLEHYGDNDWSVRFAGSAYGAVYGREVTGTMVSEIISEDLAPEVLADFRRCMGSAKPVVNSGETTWPDHGNVYRYQRLLLPFGECSAGCTNPRVTHLLGVAAFYNSSGATVF
ncbi:MAG TPA: PAS domain-containing protein [Alphaproteobacteria bacterium]|nr:PAS domain-containing protein [Alphaproteobacteria bacterium]